MTTEALPGAPRSRRGRGLYQETVLTPLQQIPVMPSQTAGYSAGAWAYYLRPDGETISDILILLPNGGIPDIDDSRKKDRLSTNASYYQLRQSKKGFEYIGQVLTEPGVRRLVEIMAANREDAILFCEDEIVNARFASKNSDRPEIRDRERKRAEQFERRLTYLQQPIDPEALVAELKEIARAQMLANVDPNVLRVMKSMLGEVNERMEAALEHFQAGRLSQSSETGPKRSGSKAADATEFDAGSKDSLDA